MVASKLFTINALMAFFLVVLSAYSNKIRSSENGLPQTSVGTRNSRDDIESNEVKKAKKEEETRNEIFSLLFKREIENSRVKRLYFTSLKLLLDAFEGNVATLDSRFLMGHLVRIDNLLIAATKRARISQKDLKDVLLTVNLNLHLIDRLSTHASYFSFHDFRTVNIAYHIYELALVKTKVRTFKELNLHPLTSLYASKAFKTEVGTVNALLATQECANDIFTNSFKHLFRLESLNKPLEFSDLEFDRNSFRLMDPVYDDFRDFSLAVRGYEVYRTEWLCTESNFGLLRKIKSGSCAYDYVRRRLCASNKTRVHRELGGGVMPTFPGEQGPQESPWINPNPSAPYLLQLPKRGLIKTSKKKIVHKKGRNTPVINSVDKKNDYHFEYALVEILRLDAELATLKTQEKREFDYNQMLRSLVKALNARYQRNYSVDSIFYEVELTDRIMGQLDSRINELRDNNVSLFCEEKDIELCENKILQPTIYVEKDSAKLRLNRVVFHPLSLIKTYGKDITIEANGLVNPWVDTSGRLVKQMKPLEMLDPGRKHVQKSGHKKKDDRNCDINFIIKDGCETHHYYKFWYEGGAAPQKMIQKDPSESAGAIEFHVEGQISLNPLLVAKGGDGDKGFTGLPSPSCVKSNDGWKLENHLLIERDWFKLGEDRSYTKAVEESRHKLKVANVRKGVAGDGGNGGHGGSVAINRPYQDHLPLYVVNVDGGAGGQGGEPHSCGPGDQKMLKGGVGRQGSRGKIYETVYP